MNSALLMLTPRSWRTWLLIILVIAMIPGGSALLVRGVTAVSSKLGEVFTTLDARIAQRDNAFVHADGSVTPAGLARAKNQLATLRVAPTGSMANYDRDLFAHWVDTDGNGCNARVDSLARWGEDIQRASTCNIVGGTWHDPYDGSTYTSPSSLDIDHVVALGEAWRSGANTWSADKRRRYANDPMVLMPVGASLNREKGDRSVVSWLPPNRAYRDDYAVRWINIKARYDLTITMREKAQLNRLLAASTATTPATPLA